MKLVEQFKEFISSQYSKPRGILGMYFGEKMVRQHRTETLWTIKLLKLQHEENILELGCGAGFAMKLLLAQESVTNVVGIDMSGTILKSAMIRNREEISRGRAKLIQGNVQQLDFQNAYFTKVFSIHSVYFWDNLPETIAEIYRVLKPEGLILLSLSDGKNGEKWNGVKDMLEQQIIPIMKQMGFKNIELIKGPDSRHYQTVAVKGNK